MRNLHLQQFFSFVRNASLALLLLVDGGFALARNSFKLCCLSSLSDVSPVLISKTEQVFFVAQRGCDKGLLHFNYGIYVE